MDGNKALLLSLKAIDTEYYNDTTNTYTDYTFWSNSTIRSWLNGYGASANREGKDYTSKNFIDTAFTKAEQETLLTTTVTATAVSYGDSIRPTLIEIDGMKDTQDTLFLLDAYFLEDRSASEPYGLYWMDNRMCRETAYAAAKGLTSPWGVAYRGAVSWMTRTLRANVGKYSQVDYDGIIRASNNVAMNIGNGVRPAVWINMNNASYTRSGRYTPSATVGNRCIAGHKAVVEAGYEATCTTEGLTDASHCLYCKEVLSTHEVIGALGHDVVIDPRLDPTCTTGGYTEGSHCQRCGEILEEQTLIPNTNHQEIADNEKKATLTADGNTEGSHCKNCGEVFMAMTIIPKISKVTLSTSTYTYDGKVKSPSLKVYDRTNALLTKGTDYILETPSGRKSVGRYTYKVTFTGNYEGTKTVTLTINPKGTTLSKLTAGKKSFTVTWKKNTTQTSGYEIQYSTSSTFKSAKTVTVSKNSTTSKTIKSLSAKKKYYVRIRTYKTVSSKKYYSAWSAKKYVTTK